MDKTAAAAEINAVSVKLPSATPFQKLQLDDEDADALRRWWYGDSDWPSPDLAEEKEDVDDDDNDEAIRRWGDGDSDWPLPDLAKEEEDVDDDDDVSAPEISLTPPPSAMPIQKLQQWLDDKDVDALRRWWYGDSDWPSPDLAEEKEDVDDDDNDEAIRRWGDGDSDWPLPDLAKEEEDVDDNDDDRWERFGSEFIC